MLSNSQALPAVFSTMALSVKDALHEKEHVHDAFLSVLRQDSFSFHIIDSPYHPEMISTLLQPPMLDLSPEHTQMFSEFVSNKFPTITISSERYVATGRDPTCKDPSEMTVHGRIANAYLEASNNPSTKAYVFLRFLVSVNILHDLAHALRTRYVDPMNAVLMQIRSDIIPYYYEHATLRGTMGHCYNECGLYVERLLFGGMIGVVFEDEIDGQRPAFFDIDYLKISYFFLLLDSGKAYQLDYNVISTWLEAGNFDKFDPQALQELDPPPSAVRMRLCAMLNSSHLPRRIAPEERDIVDRDEVNGITYESDSSDSDFDDGENPLAPGERPFHRHALEPIYHGPGIGWEKF